MTHLEQWLKDADVVIGGSHYTEHEALLDPTCWQAVGNTRGEKHRPWRGFYKGLDNGTWGLYDIGNKSESDIFAERWVPAWRYQLHRFIDHLADGMGVETALSKLA